MIDDLCGVLTFARGTLISHLYYQIHSSKNEIMYSEHYPFVTRPFRGGMPIIGTMPPQRTKDFVESTFSQFCNLASSEYDLGSLVHSWVYVRSDSFLESRGLTLIAIVEFLINRCADFHDNQNYISADMFESRRDELDKRIRVIIADLFSELDRDQINSMVAKTKGFNRRSFTNKLRRFCRIFKVPVQDDEIISFAESRNLLVHEMRFQYSDMIERSTEFFDMVHLLDRMILRMIDYTGCYHKAGESSWDSDCLHVLEAVD